ncbi:MAG: hypothetical protein ACI31S_05640 [Bacilli bacterium]
MSNDNENKIYYKRVLPFVKEEKIVKNGKEKTITVDNLSNEEIKNMSLPLPKMLWKNADGMYLTELPITLMGYGTGVKWALFYIFDDLTLEEQAKYYDRTIEIPLTKEEVVKVYSENSKPIKKRAKK